MPLWARLMGMHEQWAMKVYISRVVMRIELFRSTRPSSCCKLGPLSP